MKEALLLIDIQNGYFPGGKMELVGMEEAAKKAAELLSVLNESDITDLVICGAMSHMCIDTTVRAAK